MYSLRPIEWRTVRRPACAASLSRSDHSATRETPCSGCANGSRASTSRCRVLGRGRDRAPAWGGQGGVRAVRSSRRRAWGNADQGRCRGGIARPNRRARHRLGAVTCPWCRSSSGTAQGAARCSRAGHWRADADVNVGCTCVGGTITCSRTVAPACTGLVVCIRMTYPHAAAKCSGFTRVRIALDAIKRRDATYSEQ